MHKIRVIESTLGYPQKNRMESESYEGVQTYMDMKDGSLIAVQPNKDDLMSQILSPDNLNRAYLQVVRNKGVGGVDRMDFKQLLPYLHEHKSELIESIRIGRYKPYNPQIQISAESETKRSIFREKDKTKRSKKESAQHSKSRNKSFVMTSVSAL